MIKLRDLAAKAGRFLAGNAAAPAPARQTGVVVSDKFDAITWGDTRQQSRRLRELADDLHTHHDYADELVKDLFMAAYKTEPQVREPVEPGPCGQPSGGLLAAGLPGVLRASPGDGR